MLTPRQAQLLRVIEERIVETGSRKKPATERKKKAAT